LPQQNHGARVLLPGTCEKNLGTRLRSSVGDWFDGPSPECPRIFSHLPGGEGAEDGEGIEAEADDLGEEADDVFGVVGAVGVEAGAGLD